MSLPHNPTIKADLHRLQAKLLMENGENKVKAYWGDPEPITFRKMEEIGSGGMRKATLVQVISGALPSGTYVIKENHASIVEEWKSDYENDASVTREKFLEKEIQAQSLAGHFMEKFHGRVVNYDQFGELPRVVPVHKIRGKNFCYSIEEFLPGTWIKYNRNDGQVLVQNTISSQKMAAYSHFVFHVTDGAATVLDLQGVGMCLSDLELATREDSLFGCGNLGMEAIQQFAATHECSRFCRMAKLPAIRPAARVDTEVRFRIPEETGLCMLCCDRPHDTAVIECGHVFCAPCAHQLHMDGDGCAVCRAQILGVLKIYL